MKDKIIIALSAALLLTSLEVVSPKVELATSTTDTGKSSLIANLIINYSGFQAS